MDIAFNNLSLCSGGGGLDLGLELAIGPVSTVCWVEWEAFAIEYLAAGMEENTLAPAPIWTDLRTFDGKPWRGVVDTLTAGYPCQPFSLAGKRRGEDDPRHLWPHVARVIGECEPGIVFLENVPGHLSLGYEQVESDLQEMGYRVTPGLFTAAEVGATHKRERLFILGVVNDPSERRREGRSESEVRGGRDSIALESCSMAHATGPRLPGRKDAGTDCGNEGKDEGRRQESERSGGQRIFPTFPPGPNGDWQGIPYYLWPATQSGVCSLVDGLAAHRTSWLKLLGNGVVPLQAAYAFLSLWAAHESEQSDRRGVA